MIEYTPEYSCLQPDYSQYSGSPLSFTPLAELGMQQLYYLVFPFHLDVCTHHAIYTQLLLLLVRGVYVSFLSWRPIHTTYYFVVIIHIYISLQDHTHPREL